MQLKMYNLKTRLDFGKYKGDTVDDVITNDPQYLEWCLENVDGFCLTKSAKHELELALEVYDDWADAMMEMSPYDYLNDPY